MEPVKTEVNTEYVKPEEIVKTKQDSSEEGGAQMKNQDCFFCKTRKSIKNNWHKDIDKNIVQSLNKLYTSYNSASLNYTNHKFKDMTL